MKREITYKKVGDILIPELYLDENGATEIIGNYGMYGVLREKFLQEHKPIYYSELIVTGELMNHLEEVDRQATEMMYLLIDQAKKDKSLPDKATDPIGWSKAMNMRKLMAEEVVLNELIYV